MDTIEPPIVKLEDGTVLQINTVEQATKLRSQVVKILYLGDILISYGDFLENNAQLLPASYVEEIWAQELSEKLEHSNILADNSILEYKRLVEFSSNPYIIPSFKEALRISIELDIPLHPKYCFYWEIYQ